ncbi:hypothetical protein [Streptomyces sp. NPDC012510]|uniref:hypothetical protein n=1 Tax=Streptomyces sp. NPDC012510 TaxID=3364838 RepID=UPI0036E0A4C4
MVAPPIATKSDYLPLDQLPWQDAERLFLRLAERDGRAEYAELYGTAGQGQEGIDLFVRKHPRSGRVRRHRSRPPLHHLAVKTRGNADTGRHHQGGRQVPGRFLG